MKGHKSIVAAAALLSTACANVSVEQASHRIERGMNESEVTSRIGSSPANVSLSTCGGQSAASWDCKVWKYEQGEKVLAIYFASGPDQVWRVDSWVTY
jgi:hypothetical protein